MISLDMETSSSTYASSSSTPKAVRPQASNGTFFDVASCQTSGTYQLVARPIPAWVQNKGSGLNAAGSQSTTRAPPTFGHYSGSTSQLISPDDEVNIGIVDHVPLDKSRWNGFISGTGQPIPFDQQGTLVDEKVLDAQEDLSSPWMGANGSSYRDPDEQKGRKKLIRSKKNGVVNIAGDYALGPTRYLVSKDSRKQAKIRLIHTLLNHAHVPLTLRLTIFVLSVVALGLACSIFVHSSRVSTGAIPQMPSTIMAVCVQCFALVYLVYITFDEYLAPPIGLREAKAKVRLIMLDLLFIIFSSANLSLTFNTLYDKTWVCQETGDPYFDSNNVAKNSSICERQRGLASLLFMVLVMWVLTFTISIFRLVERVT